MQLIGYEQWQTDSGKKLTLAFKHENERWQAKIVAVNGGLWELFRWTRPMTTRLQLEAHLMMVCELYPEDDS